MKAHFGLTKGKAKELFIMRMEEGMKVIGKMT